MAAQMASPGSGAGSPRRRPALALAGFVLLCLIAGGLGSIATTPNIAGWYEGLAKPWFTPPNAAFPIVWTLLYVLMAVSAWLVWRGRVTSPDIAAAQESMWMLVPFYVQLVLNVGWSFAFFAGHSPYGGLVVITPLIAVIVWTIASFWQVSKPAAVLLAPYLVWVGFASLLNAAINTLN